MKERIKELNSLYGIIKLLQDPNTSINEILAGVLEVIKSSMQFPAICCVKIVFNDREYVTSNFTDTPWKISNNTIKKN